MLPIAVDAMGGDRGPGEIVTGAREAAERFGLPVALVGRPDALKRSGGLEVWPATEVIEMAEDPLRAVRGKRDASVLQAAEAVRDGRASSMVSAGHTGAALAGALLRIGRIPGVVRPAIAATVPVPTSTPTVLVDAGANLECRPRWLLQFGQMGAVYAAHGLGNASPRVGLLSMGGENGKGNELVRAAYRLLGQPQSLCQGQFIGNVEGHEILTGRADVIVTDGFTGNIVLKTLEGSIRTVLGAALQAVPSAAEGPGTLSRATLQPLRARLDPATYGGAMLLGVGGVCIIAHGSSSAPAITNAIRLAANLATNDLVGAIRSAMSAARSAYHQQTPATQRWTEHDRR